MNEDDYYYWIVNKQINALTSINLSGGLTKITITKRSKLIRADDVLHHV